MRQLDEALAAAVPARVASYVDTCLARFADYQGGSMDVVIYGFLPGIADAVRASWSPGDAQAIEEQRVAEGVSGLYHDIAMPALVFDSDTDRDVSSWPVGTAVAFVASSSANIASEKTVSAPPTLSKPATVASPPALKGDGPTMREAFAAWYGHSKARTKTTDEFGSAVARFVAGFGDMAVAHVDRRTVRAFRDREAAPGAQHYARPCPRRDGRPGPQRRVRRVGGLQRGEGRRAARVQRPAPAPAVRLIDRASITDAEYVYHSFRHALTAALRELDSVKEAISDLRTGHSFSISVGRKYGRDAGRRTLHRAIEQVSYDDVDWDVAIRAAQQRVARDQSEQRKFAA